MGLNSPAFFGWVFILSIPFWMMGILVEFDLPIKLPVSSLLAFIPALVALFLTYRVSGLIGMQELLGRIFDYKRIQNKWWYMAIFLLMPIIMILGFGLMVGIGYDIKNPQAPLLIAPFLFILFFIAATGEELGWQGYGYESLSGRYTALTASLILGVLWALWHILLYIQTGNSLTDIFWQCLVLIGLRIMIVWIYVNTGRSIFSAIMFHTMLNVCVSLFPNYGSYYDPFLTSIIVWIAVVLIVVLWGKTLAQYRFNTPVE